MAVGALCSEALREATSGASSEVMVGKGSTDKGCSWKEHQSVLQEDARFADRGCGWEEHQSRHQKDTQTNLPAARTNFLQTHEGTNVSCFIHVRKARGYPGIDMSRLI